MSSGRIFEIKRFAVHDGPGIRTTVFLKGCPLSCLWCHNPEGISDEPEIAFHERKCMQCGDCFMTCPFGLHSIDENGTHTIKREACRLCRLCVDTCMPQALRCFGTEYSPEALFEIAVADIDFYKQSGGGVTCSGGEPLMQADFTAEFLSICKASEIHTAVDTSGCAPWQAFEKVLPVTDIFLYDLKHMDPVEHKKLTGADNRQLLENLRKLSEQGMPVEVRIPILPGLNSGEQNILQTAKFLKTIKSLTQIRVLPYHALSGSKYSAIGRPCHMPTATGRENIAVQQVVEAFGRENLPVCM